MRLELDPYPTEIRTPVSRCAEPVHRFELDESREADFGLEVALEELAAGNRVEVHQVLRTVKRESLHRILAVVGADTRWDHFVMAWRLGVSETTIRAWLKEVEPLDTRSEVPDGPLFLR